MKSAILICLLVFSIAIESRHLQKRDHDHPRLINDIVKKVGKSNVDKLILVMVAQDFQKCTVDEHLKTHAKIMEVVDNCETHPEEDDCKKPVMTLYHDIVCKDGDIEQFYPWTTECCGKEESERIKCFLKHRDVKSEDYKIPDIDAACKEHKEHPQHAFYEYISSIAKKHSKLYPPAVVGISFQHNQITTECCAAEDKEKCFLERITQLKKLTNYIEDKNKQNCRIIEDFPERVTQALTLTQICQKFGKAKYEVVEKLTLEAVHVKKDCCEGNTVECMLERLEATDHVCADKDKISSLLGPCCGKPILERTQCIVALPNDETDATADLKEYYEDEHVCENYHKDKTKYLAHFTYDYCRRHQESAPQSCLRVSKGYEDLLEKCCSSANAAECIKEAPKLLEAAHMENAQLTKENCDGLAQLGYKDYVIELLSRYVLKMPKVTSPTLAGLAAKMAGIGVYCCNMPDNKKQVCAEEKLDILLGEMCEMEKQTFVNDGVHHCCKDSYANRRPCFTKLGPDRSYAPPLFDITKLHFTPELCVGSPEKQLQHRLMLLVDFLKMKPNCDKEKFKGIVGSFRTLMDTCCAAEDKSQCYEKEKHNLITLAIAA